MEDVGSSIHEWHRGGWLLAFVPCLFSPFGSQLWSCRLEKSCHCQAFLEVLFWGCPQHRTYLAPTVSPPTSWVPGLLSAEHLLKLLPGVETMAATLTWPKHVFGEGLPETWPSLSPSSPNVWGPAPTRSNSTEGFLLYECETEPREAGVAEGQNLSLGLP